MEKLLLEKSIEATDLHLAQLYRDSMNKNINAMRSLYEKIIRESENGTVRINDLYKFNRYWQVKSDINKRLMALGQQEVKVLDKDLNGMYMKVNQYFNENPKFLAKTTNGRIVQKSMNQIDLGSPVVALKGNEVVNSLWCVDGKVWSDRLSDNNQQLAQDLEKGLFDVIARGSAPEDLVATLTQKYDSSFGRMERLVRTELNHIYNQAAAERYQDAGCDMYEILSNQADDESCAPLNGATYRFSEMVEGENCPPFHPNCKCTILPVIGG